MVLLTFFLASWNWDDRRSMYLSEFASWRLRGWLPWSLPHNIFKSFTVRTFLLPIERIGVGSDSRCLTAAQLTLGGKWKSFLSHLLWVQLGYPPKAKIRSALCLVQKHNTGEEKNCLLTLNSDNNHILLWFFLNTYRFDVCLPFAIRTKIFILVLHFITIILIAYLSQKRGMQLLWRVQKQLQQLKWKISFNCIWTFKFFINFMLVVPVQYLNSLKYQAVCISQIWVNKKMRKGLVCTQL